MDEKFARQRLEAIGIDDEMIEEVIPLIVREQEPASSGFSATQTEETELRQAMLSETDWRKRAAMAARIVSLNLEA